MKRGLAAAALVFGLVGLVGPAARAGGACMYNAELTDERGTEVVMTPDNCFTPTILRVERGETVRFVNDSGWAHTVGGVAGTFGVVYKEIPDGKTVSYEFTGDGVYPYICLLHPGMAGAVVVGDGRGAVGDQAVTEVSAAVDVPVAPAKAQTHARESRSGVLTASLIGGGTAGAGLVALVAIRARRRQSS